jgi:hypothetical protein
MASNYNFTKIEDPDAKMAYRVHRDDVDLGVVWRTQPDRWLVMTPGGEITGSPFTTREQAADWLWGRYSVTDGDAAKHIPDDPYAGL